MHHTRINFLITREIQNNFVELNHTRDEKVDTRVMHFQEQPSSPGGNHTLLYILFFIFQLQNLHLPFFYTVKLHESTFAI